MVLFRVVFVTRRPFLESPGNLSGLKLYFEIPIFSENRAALRARRVTFGSFLEGPGNLSGPQTYYVFIHPKGLKFFKNYPAKISA